MHRLTLIAQTPSDIPTAAERMMVVQSSRNVPVPSGSFAGAAKRDSLALPGV